MNPIIKLFRFTKSLNGYYAFIIFCGLVATAATLATPFIIGRAADTVMAVLNGSITVAQAMQTVVMLVVVFLVIELVATGISAIGGRAGDVMSEKMRLILSSRYYEKLLGLPQRYFDDELTGTIVSRLDRTIVQVTQLAKMFANNMFSMLLTTVAVLVITAFYAWPIALLIAVLFPIYVWLTALTSKKWQVYEHEKNEEVDAARGRFNEVVGQLNLVRSFAQERREWQGFDSRFHKVVEITGHQSNYWHGMDAIRRSVLNIVFAAIYGILFWQTVQSTFTVGEMVLLIQLVTMARQPVAMMSWIIDSLQHAVAGSKDYFDVMELELDPREGIHRQSHGVLPEKIDPLATPVKFANVGFAYNEGEDVLHEISFAIERGERVALVSGSGGGKSTIVSALLGFYPVSAGKIELFGQDIAGLEMEQLRQQIGVVFQDASLFSGTIRENIAYGKPDAAEAEIIAAAKRANAWDFISEFADGLDTVIGERGLKLSGGQKQRVAVARAMLKDAPVLILDEATSALDTKSERAVQRSLDALMEGRSSLIIAHRLSTIQNVDRIITLRNGRIDEVGSPAELAVSGGIYAELLALQNDGSQKSVEHLKERFGITL